MPSETFSYPQYAALGDHNRSFDGLAGWGGITASLNAGDSAELVSGIIVTGNFFDVLGLRAARGRLLSPRDDEAPGAHPVAVISHEFWRSRFDGRDGVIGREPRLNGHVFTIVGRTAGFTGPQLGSARHLRAHDDAGDHAATPAALFRRTNPRSPQNPTNSWIFGVGASRRA